MPSLRACPLGAHAGRAGGRPRRGGTTQSESGAGAGHRCRARPGHRTQRRAAARRRGARARPQRPREPSRHHGRAGPLSGGQPRARRVERVGREGRLHHAAVRPARAVSRRRSRSRSPHASAWTPTSCCGPAAPSPDGCSTSTATRSRARACRCSSNASTAAGASARDRRRRRSDRRHRRLPPVRVAARRLLPGGKPCAPRAPAGSSRPRSARPRTIRAPRRSGEAQRLRLGPGRGAGRHQLRRAARAVGHGLGRRGAGIGRAGAGHVGDAALRGRRLRGRQHTARQLRPHGRGRHVHDAERRPGQLPAARTRGRGVRSRERAG